MNNKKEIDLKDALVTKAYLSKKENLSIPNIDYKISIGVYKEVVVNGAKLIKIAENDKLKHINFDKVYTSAALARKIGVLRQTIKHNQSNYFVLKVSDRDLFYVP